MKFLLNRAIKGFADCRYPEDVKRLFNIALANGYLFTCSELEGIWEQFSNTRCAQWLSMHCYEDSDLLKVLAGKEDEIEE